MKLPNPNQSGFAPLALIIILLASIIAGTVLVQQRTHIIPHAQDCEDDCGGGSGGDEGGDERNTDSQNQDPDPQPDPVVTDDREPSATDNPEPQPPPPQGDTDNPDRDANPVSDEPVADEPKEGDEGFIKKASNLVANLVDNALDVTDSLGVTNGEKRKEDDIITAEDEGTKIKNRLVDALKDPENGEKNKSDLRSELDLDPNASDDELFDALRTAWSEKGITVSGDSFEEFIVYTGQGSLVALSTNPNSVTDVSLAPITNVALGLGAGCAGSSLGVVQTQIVCGPSDLSPPPPSGPSQSVGIKIPTEDEQPYCNEAGGFQSNCKAVPERLPICSSVGYQEACVQKTEELPTCSQGFQTGCVIDTSDKKICAEQGFQDNCIYIPKPITQPSGINSACLDLKNLLDPGCANGGAGPLTSKPTDPLSRQTPVVIIDDDTQDDRLAQDSLARAQARQQSILENNEASIKELRDLIEQTEQQMSSESAAGQIYLRVQIRDFEQRIEGYLKEIDDANRNLKFAQNEYEVSKDPQVLAKRQELDRKSTEANRASIDAQNRAKYVLEWAEKNVDGYQINRPREGSEDSAILTELRSLETLAKSNNNDELKKLVEDYKVASETEKSARTDLFKTLKALEELRTEKLLQKK